jgi:FkbM family methyltransferase
MDAEAGFCPADDAALEAAADALPPDALTVVDFDGTLLLQNSTHLYMQTLRPRFIGRPLISLLEMTQPWRLLPGPNPRWIFRDWLRVLVVTVLLPWSPWLWRRACARIAREHKNAGLLRALASRPAGTVVVATYGFRFLVAPLLDAMGCSWQLRVAAPLLSGFRLRRIGKAEAVRRAVGSDVLRRSMLVTDSCDDRDFLPLCGQAYLVTTGEESPAMSNSGGYVPLQYLQHCKRGGENMILRTILFYDLFALFLAYGPASPRPLPCLIGLLFFQLAFWTIYELGNWENDVLGAAFEDKPHIPPGFDHWRERVRPRQAWLWATGLCVPCALCFAAVLTPPDGGAWVTLPRPLMVASIFAALLAYLIASRLCYAFYNRIDVRSRVFVYPLMQISKGVGLALLLPVAQAGFMFLVSVVLVRELRYVAYRYAKTRDALEVPINLHILACFVFLATVSVLLTLTAPPSFWVVAGVVVLWHLQRGRRDLMDLYRGFEWLPRRRGGHNQDMETRHRAPKMKISARFKDAFPPSWRLKRSVASAREAGEPELRFLPVLCKPDFASLDVGANRGTYSYIMRQHSKMVIAFEPNAHYAAFLRRALRDVKVLEVAASDHAGVATLRVPYRDAVAGMGTIESENILAEAFHESKVETLTLDSLALPPIGFMKIDVEGHELAVLHGAASIIERDHPNLIIEAEERHRQGAVKSIIEFLAGYGYEGVFFFNGEICPIADFDTSVHQRLDPDTHRHFGDYVNNFIFVLSRDVESLRRVALPKARHA